MRRRIVGFPILFGVERTPAKGLVQTVAPTIVDRSLARGVDIELRLNHDAKKIVARTGDGSLNLTVMPAGVFVEATFDPATAAGRELAAAMDAGTIAGGSYGWRPIWNRWDVSGDPVRCEVRDAHVHEVSIVIKPHVPRFAGTWAGELRGELAERWAELERDRNRFGIRRPAPDGRRADLVVTLPAPDLADVIVQRLGAEDHVTTEWGRVRRAAQENPAAKIIDTYMPQPLPWDTVKRQAERLGVPYRGPAWSIETMADKVEKKRAAKTETTQRASRTPNMNANDDLPPERRPAVGSDCARAELFATAHRSFTKFKAALTAVGDRPPLGTDGTPQAWNESRGWHERSTSGVVLRASSMLEKLTRHRQNGERIAAQDQVRNPHGLRSKQRKLAQQATRIKAAK